MKKQLIIVEIAILLIVVSLSGCFDTDNDEIETITISGVDEVQTINNLDNPIKLIVSGVNCNVTVTKETNLVEVVLSGVDNTVKVSRSHSFTSTVSGVDSEIVYYD